MDITVCVITAVVAYLLGSIPSGYLAGLVKGVDVRTLGSGNIGATNVFRTLGKTAGVIVLVADGLKGWFAVDQGPLLVHKLVAPSAVLDQATLEYLKIIAGIVVILGHNYTCWLKFKGGKGIATTAGVLAALVPWTFVIGLSTWIVVLLLTRYVSVASIAAALSLPPATWLSGYSYRLIIVTIAMCVLAIYKHKPNIGRLMNGTESRIGQKKVPPTTGAVES